MVTPLVGHLRAHQKADLNGGLDWTCDYLKPPNDTWSPTTVPAGGAWKDNSSGPSVCYFSNDCCIAS
jgi:hypothetical protein